MSWGCFSYSNLGFGPVADIVNIQLRCYSIVILYPKFICYSVPFEIKEADPTVQIHIVITVMSDIHLGVKFTWYPGTGRGSSRKDPITQHSFVVN